MTVRTIFFATFALGGGILTAGPAIGSALSDKTAASPAIVVLRPTQGNQVTGTVTFLPTKDGVRVEGELTGLTPGPHGFHVHAYGDCSAKDGKSAGGHFNPEGKKHGGPAAAERHVGDLGNIVADQSGTARIDFTDKALRLDGPASVIGRGVIVHAGKDDLKSQPSGAAGPRVACGVIGIKAK